MKNITLLKLCSLVTVVGFLSVSSIQATIVCQNWSADSSSGSSIFGCDLYSGTKSGNYNSSYVCNANSGNGYCTVEYVGGNSCDGVFSVICKDASGSSYSCDINWNGKDNIDCEYLPYNCNEIEICRKTPTPTPQIASVPEPSTVIAGALLLLPLGVSAVRILRKGRNI